MRRDPDLVTAIADGVIVDDLGDVQHIMAGRTRVHRSLWSELRRPEVAALFGLRVAESGFTRSRSSAPAMIEEEIPELRADATPKLTAKLWKPARREIRNELRRAEFPLSHGFETGGFLVAERTFRSTLDVRTATGLEGDGQRFLDAVRLDDGNVEQLERGFSVNAPHLRVVGGWHCHSSRPDPLPSDADRRVALKRADEWDLSSRGWLTLIVTDPSGEWRRPTVTGWVTRRSHGGYAVTEPAVIEGSF